VTQRVKFASIGIAVVLLVLFASGSDNNKPSSNNFKAALQKHFDDNQLCISWLDIDLERDGKLSPNAGYRDPALLEALGKHGMLVSQGNGRNAVYSIPSDQRSHWKIQQAGLGSTINIPCYGHGHVESVQNYTEPASALGVNLSQVTYTWKADKLLPWVTDPGVQGFLSRMKPIIEGQVVESKKVMILTNKGWVPKE
jgi:hypothetical protein